MSYISIYLVPKRDSNHWDRKKIVINPLCYLQATSAGYVQYLYDNRNIEFPKLPSVSLLPFQYLGHSLSPLRAPGSNPCPTLTCCMQNDSTTMLFYLSHGPKNPCVYNCNSSIVSHNNKAGTNWNCKFGVVAFYLFAILAIYSKWFFFFLMVQNNIYLNHVFVEMFVTKYRGKDFNSGSVREFPNVSRP